MIGLIFLESEPPTTSSVVSRVADGGRAHRGSGGGIGDLFIVFHSDPKWQVLTMLRAGGLQSGHSFRKPVSIRLELLVAAKPSRCPDKDHQMPMQARGYLGGAVRYTGEAARANKIAYR